MFALIKSRKFDCRKGLFRGAVTVIRKPSAFATFATVLNTGFPSGDKALYKPSRVNPVSLASQLIFFARPITPSACTMHAGSSSASMEGGVTGLLPGGMQAEPNRIPNRRTVRTIPNRSEFSSQEAHRPVAHSALSRCSLHARGRRRLRLFR